MVILPEGTQPKQTPINEGQFSSNPLDDKQGFGLDEPIDPSELRNIPLSKIKDFDTLQREYLTSTSAETTGSIAGMTLSAGDLVCYVDESISDKWQRASADQNFGDLSSQNHIVLVYDCGSGMKIDSITVKLKKNGSSTSTIDAQITSGFTTVSSSKYNETGITTHETSSNSVALNSLSGVYSEQTFNFAGNIYTGVVGIKIRWNGTVSAVNQPVIYRDTTQGNHPRAEAHTVDTSVSPVEWNQINDIWWTITGDYDGLYKAHGDFPQRSIIIGEVLEAATAGSTVRLNTSGIAYKQTSLTAGDKYKVGYNGLDTTSAYLAGIALTSNILRISQLDFPLTKFDIISFNRNVTDATADVAYNHSLGRKPQLIIFYSQEVTTPDARSIGAYVLDSDKNLCIWYDPDASDYNIDSSYSIRHETVGNEAQLGKVIECTTTDFTISWTEYLTPASEDTVNIAILIG